MAESTRFSQSTTTLDDLIAASDEFRSELRAVREATSPVVRWYPYDTLSNLVHLDQLLRGEYRSFDFLTGNLPVADIGAADGEFAFLLSRFGFHVDVFDHAPTNHNGLEGVRTLAKYFAPNMKITDVDLDRHPISDVLPSGQKYGLAIFLGILYHLKNPFLAMEQLAQICQRCIISTRVTRFAPDRARDISDLSLAYLVDDFELNGDPTNFWIFTETGLSRLFARSGWKVVSAVSVGDISSSDPVSMNHDERIFALLECSK